MKIRINLAPKFMAEGRNDHGTIGFEKEDNTEPVEDFLWDQGEIGSWHKHHGNQSSHVTDPTNGEVPSPAHQGRQPNDEILTEWDSQFDFCLKDSPQSSPLKSRVQKENSQKSPKVRVKEVFFKGKDFVKSKVNSYKEKFSRNSMKDSKKKAKHSTAENDRKNGEEFSVSDKGDNSNGFKKGDNSGQNGGQSEPKSLVMTSEKKSLTVSEQNGNRNNDSNGNHGNYMTLPEAYTSYDSSTVRNGDRGFSFEEASREQRYEVPNGNGNDPEGISSQNDQETIGRENEASGFKGQDEVKVVVEEAENKVVNGTDDDQQVLEEAIPLGSEAQSFEKTNGAETVQLEVPVDKRLKWLLGNLEQASFGSDFSQNTATSTSSDISVDMLLQERSDDPEEILTNLGFGDSNAENPVERIPDRFKDISTSDSVPNIFTDNPEFTQLLQAFTSQQEAAAGNSEPQQATSMEAMMAGHGNPNYNSMLHSVMHGMKFLNFLKQGFNAEKEPEHPSVLQNPKNREFLQQQGFYEKYNPSSKLGDDSKNKLTRSQSLDASEKRKRFQATKSRNYSSLTNVPEQDEVPTSQRNFQSFSTSYDTAHTSATSFDYGRSMTSMETSTDSFDSGDSSERRRRELVRPDPVQSNIGDSGIWNTQDSTRSIDDEYLAEFSRDSARQRRSDVTRMMSGDHYNVGDDADILKSPPLSRTPSLEATLTPSSFHKLEAKSSTLKDSFDDDLDIYSEKYLCDTEAGRSHSLTNGNNSAIKAEKTKQQFAAHPNGSPPTKSGWQKFQRRYGVEMSVRVPGDRTELSLNKSSDKGDNTDSGIPMDQVSSDKSMDKADRPGLGSIGKIESVQSDSSGFAEAETTMPEPQIIQKVSSMGSSTESDQTFKSSITILPTKSSMPKTRVTSPEDKMNSSLNKSQNLSMDTSNCESGSEDSPTVSRIDIAVGTDDFSEFLHAPTVSYHIHERDQEDSGTCSEGDKSVILTIELPKKWVNTNPNRREGKPRVISHLYKEIGHPSRSASIDLDSHTGGAFSAYQRGKSNYPLIRTVSDGNVPMDFPNRSSTPYGQMSSTPYGKPPNFRLHPDLKPSLLSPRSTSPSSLSVFSDIGHGHVNYQSDHSFNYSTPSLASKTESVASLCNNSLEYYKLMKLVNQPVSFKTDSSGHKGILRFEPKFSIKKWTQLRKQQQLEEETKLVQHTLQKYKAELNMMESQFLVKTQLVKDDLSYGDREDVQELQYLWAELRKEVLLMEQTLANRLSGIKIGNDNYNPLLALDVVRKMTELLREQIYQQQMASEKDEETIETTHSATMWPSTTTLDTKPSISDLDSEHSFNSSLAELKETILTEVRQELHDNTQWLHKELQKKEKELNALKMELMANNINTGATRKKHFFESDV